MEKIREKLSLTYEEHMNLCSEDFLQINGIEIPIDVVSKKYGSGGRHQEYWDMIFERTSDHVFFEVSYSTSVKDSMGWEECNSYGDFEATQVFPKEVTTIIFT
jgi:hypothetical protein